MNESTIPGPWHVKGDRVRAAKGGDIAICVRPQEARLCAAAPDLLEALEALLARRDVETETKAGAAILKARGT